MVEYINIRGIFMDKYNELVRKEVDDRITELQIKNGCSIKEAIRFYMDELYQKFDNVSSVIKDEYSLYKNVFIGVLFIDAYKFYSYKTKVHLATDVDKDVFFQLYNFEDMDDLLTEISANPDLFGYMLNATYSFYNMDKLGKQMVLNSLASSENEYLMEIFNPHQYDVLKEQDELNIENIVFYFRRQQLYMQKIMEVDFDDEVIWEIISYLKYTSIDKKDEVVAFYKELMITDYKMICKILKSENDKELQKRLKFYSSNDMPTIMNEMSFNQDFLFDILKNYIDVVVNLKVPEFDVDSINELDNQDEETLKKLLKV